jgi:hypothetical protein
MVPYLTSTACVSYDSHASPYSLLRLLPCVLAAFRSIRLHGHIIDVVLNSGTLVCHHVYCTMVLDITSLGSSASTLSHAGYSALVAYVCNITRSTCYLVGFSRCQRTCGLGGRFSRLPKYVPNVRRLFIYANKRTKLFFKYFLCCCESVSYEQNFFFF